MRATWTDTRLDDFARNTDRRLDELTIRVGELSGRIDSLQRTIIQVGGGMMVGFVGVLAAMIGLIATQV